jgi:CheY-like chemotaxis protein
MRILFVEDEENAIIGACAILGSRGDAVDVAGTADEALASVRDVKYDLLLLDIMLPPGEALADISFREAGKEFAAKLRAGAFGSLKTERDVPIIALTAVCDLGVLESLRKLECMEVLTKPISAEDIVKAIEEMAER